MQWLKSVIQVAPHLQNTGYQAVCYDFNTVSSVTLGVDVTSSQLLMESYFYTHYGKPQTADLMSIECTEQGLGHISTLVLRLPKVDQHKYYVIVWESAIARVPNFKPILDMIYSMLARMKQHHDRDLIAYHVDGEDMVPNPIQAHRDCTNLRNTMSHYNVILNPDFFKLNMQRLEHSCSNLPRQKNLKLDVVDVGEDRIIPMGIHRYPRDGSERPPTTFHRTGGRDAYPENPWA